MAFCRWLTEKYQDNGLLEEGWEIRLPTEWKWGIAARYPDDREYPWGNGYRVGNANCDEQEGGCGPYFLNKTILYELGKQTELDIYDMAGTIRERALSKSDDGSNLIDASGDWRVLRGGAIHDLPSDLRTTSRYISFPDNRANSIGFRLCAAPIGAITL